MVLKFIAAEPNVRKCPTNDAWLGRNAVARQTHTHGHANPLMLAVKRSVPSEHCYLSNLSSFAPYSKTLFNTLRHNTLCAKACKRV